MGVYHINFCHRSPSVPVKLKPQ